jgi:hypothetical protein
MICWPVSPRVGNLKNNDPSLIASIASITSEPQENGGNVTQPRAADDFPRIRARIEELRRERARPRAADDFATIRARLEELRRERAHKYWPKRGAVR